MNRNKAARDCGNSHRAIMSAADNEIVSKNWTRAQCRAIEIALGGGFLILAILQVMFRW